MWYTQEGNTLTLFLYIQPGAKSTEISEIYDGALKIRLQAPPIDGLANKALQKFLAQQFKVPLKNVKLIRGEKNRRKVFSILNTPINPEHLI